MTADTMTIQQILERLDGRTVLHDDVLADMGIFASFNGGGMIDLHWTNTGEAFDCVTFAQQGDPHHGDVAAAYRAAAQWATEDTDN